MANEVDGIVNVTLQSTAKSKEPVRFFGTHTAKLATGTNQVTLPKAIKKAVEEGDEGHLMLFPRAGKPYWQLYTKKAFNQLVEDTKKDARFQENNFGKNLAHAMVAKAVAVEYDTQGRFVVGKEFAAKLKGESNEVTFVAVHEYVNLWTTAEYTAEQEKQKPVEMSDEMLKAMEAILDR
jgi:DNA-binding transcriptional regulator/RsmH inhibitor MraZ